MASLLLVAAARWYEVGVPFRPASSYSRLLTWAVIALLFGGTVLVYTRAVGYGFVNYDDPRYVAANPQVQAPFGWDTVVWAFTAKVELWQPVTWFSHILDWHLYGDNAGGHHLTSILWHALNAVLAFVVFRKLTGTFWLSAFAAALFAWHPQRVESVAWITERKDVMSGCLFFLTILAYVSYAEARRSGHRAIGRYGIVLVAFTLGLLCKPTLVTLPIVLLAFDVWPLHRLRGSSGAVNRFSTKREQTAGPSGVTETAAPDEEQLPAARWLPVRLLLEKVPLFALSVGVSLVTMHLQKDWGAFTLNLPVSARLANVPVAMVRYLGKFFWPTNLSVCYPHPGWWPATFVVAAIAIVLAITYAAWRWRRSAPWLAVGWIWFVALLLPTVGIVQVGFQSMADRYTYLPMLGWELALLWTLRAAFTNTRLLSSTRLTVTTAIAGGMILGGCGVRTWQQEATWRDSLSLFRHAIAASGSSSVAEGFLGYTLASTGAWDEAALHANRALALDPKNEMAVYTLARVDANQGKVDEAITAYRRSLALKPNEPGTEYELALQLLQRGDVAEAQQLLAQAAKQKPGLVAENARLAAVSAVSGNLPAAALRYVAATLIDPANARAHFAAAMALERLGREREALAGFQRAVELQPNFIEAHVELGLLLVRQQDARQAIPHLRRALAVRPELAAANVGLARAYEALGETSEADRCFERALQSAPNDAEVTRAWADTLARRGRFSEAVTFYRRAVAQRPGDAMTHAGLGYALWLTGHRDEAVTAWKDALRINPNFPGLRERLEKLGINPL